MINNAVDGGLADLDDEDFEDALLALPPCDDGSSFCDMMNEMIDRGLASLDDYDFDDLQIGDIGGLGDLYSDGLSGP